MEDVVEKSETMPEPEQPEAPEPIVVSPPEPKKKRGRPAGAKDAQPRKKKITIQEEAPPPPPDPPEPPQEPKEPPQPEPISPRTALREAGELINRSQHAKKEARKTNLRELYCKHLLSLP